MILNEKKEILLSRKQTAEYLCICKTTLDRLGIPATRIRRRVFYRQIVLEQWLRDQTEQKGGSHG